MGKAIFKVDDNGEERFLIWSSVVDAPVTFGCTAAEIEAYFVEEAIERAKRDTAEMLARARQTGTSSHGGGTLADCDAYNHAGPSGIPLNEDEIVEFYVRRKEEPTKEALIAYRKGRRR